jgi:cell division cycle protein 37
MLSYGEFTDKYQELLEVFMKLEGMEANKNFLLANGNVLLQEHASSYLLLASLEDEMNGEREKMKKTARQSQILTNIIELAKSLKKHPGNVIVPFFIRVSEDKHSTGFQEGVDIFVDRIIKRSIDKKKEMEAEGAEEEFEEEEEEVNINDLPLEDRLGPGGLDPVEVFESLPKELQEAFESRDTEALKDALVKMSVEDAKLHMDRCAKSGLWNAA